MASTTVTTSARVMETTKVSRKRPVPSKMKTRSRGRQQGGDDSTAGNPPFTRTRSFSPHPTRRRQTKKSRPSSPPRGHRARRHVVDVTRHPSCGAHAASRTAPAPPSCIAASASINNKNPFIQPIQIPPSDRHRPQPTPTSLHWSVVFKS